MNKNSIKQRIEELIKLINQHNYNYYVLDKPTISDYDFDILLKELEELEKQNPALINPDSPTQRIGGQITKKFDTVVHKFPMLSLANTYSSEELYEFDNRIKKSIQEAITYVCELKFDGVAIGLNYKNGKLHQAVTRGDGVRGDLVTANVRTIRSIPLQIDADDIPEEFEVRGEIIMPHKSFMMLNEQKEQSGEAPFANPRNAASGSLKLQDSSLVAKRNLDCFIYGLWGDNLPFASHFENLEKARNWGFKVSPLTSKCENIEQVMQFINETQEERAKLPYDIDGVVIKVNSYALQEKLGFTSKFPRWAISYKYKAEQGITKIKNIDYQVGRTGVITPVALLDPVPIAGTVVKRASLYNADRMNELDLHYQDTVFVEKGGEIIPKIVKVDTSQRGSDARKLSFISHCPECNTPLKRAEGEALYYCPNEEICPPQIKGKIEHFISRRAMNIEGLGEGRIEVLIQNELLENIADLYILQYDDLLGLENVITDVETGKQRKIGFREKTVTNILAAIKNSLEVPFERVLFALGIRHLGETVAKKLARHFGDIDAIQQSSTDELIAIPEIGEKIAASISEYFSKEKNREIISQLKKAGLKFTIEKPSGPANKPMPLSGKSFVVSGVFQNYSRDQLKELIEKSGGKNISSLSSKTSFLLAGDKMGPEKKKKAAELNIPLISEKDFEKLLSESTN